jgi:hypothetical protein
VEEEEEEEEEEKEDLHSNPSRATGSGGNIHVSFATKSFQILKP